MAPRCPPEGPKESPGDAKNLHKSAQDVPKSPPRVPQRSPRGPQDPQEPPKRPPRTPKSSPRGPQDPPRAPQEAPKTPQEVHNDPPGRSFQLPSEAWGEGCTAGPPFFLRWYLCLRTQRSPGRYLATLSAQRRKRSAPPGQKEYSPHGRRGKQRERKRGQPP